MAGRAVPLPRAIAALALLVALLPRLLVPQGFMPAVAADGFDGGWRIVICRALAPGQDRGEPAPGPDHPAPGADHCPFHALPDWAGGVAPLAAAVPSVPWVIVRRATRRRCAPLRRRPRRHPSRAPPSAAASG